MSLIRKFLLLTCFSGRSVSSENSESEHSEKSPLVLSRSLTKMLFNKTTKTHDSGATKEGSPTRLTQK